MAGVFGVDLGLAVGSYAVEFVVFEQGVVVGDAVDGGGGDVDKAINRDLLGGLQEEAGSGDLGGDDLIGLIERQGGGGVDNLFDTAHGGGDDGFVADVAFNKFDLVGLGVVEVDTIEDTDGTGTLLQ